MLFIKIRFYDFYKKNKIRYTIIMINKDQKRQLTYKYFIKLDINQDALNWYFGCNKIYQNVDWKKDESEEVVNKIHGESQEQALNLLVPYLEQKYVQEKKQISDEIAFLNKEFTEKFNIACQKIVDLFGRPLYRDNFTIYLTTFGRCPYNYEEGYLLIQ